ncbi:hypothetical protein H5410_028205 [Solanum commersonii]|uniref:Uncharacterized protein n=1 Tax=Solanum commersonii TaxID=4109 RepID=A0A9J5Z1E4_SOLCO|nr:hypothetical protein H5410_028205 [Solanum commersonii]
MSRSPTAQSSPQDLTISKYALLLALHHLFLMNCYLLLVGLYIQLLIYCATPLYISGGSRGIPEFSRESSSSASRINEVKLVDFK